VTTSNNSRPTCCSWSWRLWLWSSAAPRHCFKSSNCQIPLLPLLYC